MNGAPQKTLRSEQFDDVYFSAENGLAEARHVFLAGNGLPAAWAGRDVFTIAETGFGTGLNFLAVWQLFAETAKAGQRLEFISVEKYPLTRDEIAAALEPFAKDFAALMPVYLAQYPHVQTDRVSLRMIEGDVNDVLPSLDAAVDAWFLDGFKPSSNPQMWSEAVFSNMARLSKPGASFATFTAAGFVRRGLQEAGFHVRKIKGYGRKREMSVGEMPCG